MSNLTAQEYDQITKKASPNSRLGRNMLVAFLVGGAICTLGEFLTNMYVLLGIGLDEAYTLASVTLVFLSAVFTGLNLYDNLAKYAGAGTLVPITGFSNAVVSPAIEFKAEGFIVGLGAKMFVIAGPVIVYGTIASVVYGLIIYLFKLY